MKRGAVAIGTIAFCLSTANVCFAEPSAAEIENARKLFKQAETDEAAQKWDIALGELRRASAIKMTAGLRFHIALCEMNLHQLAAALDDYTAADLLARTEGNTDVQEAVREPRADLDARVPKVKLTIPPDAKNVEVRVDTTVVNDPSEPLRLEPGPHTIEAKSEGRGTFSKKLALKERDDITVAILLPLLIAGPTQTTGPESPPPEPAPSSSSKRNYVPAILATAGAVVLAGAGLGSFLIAGGAQSDAQAACTTGSSDCDGDKSKVHTWDAVALGAWIGAAGVAGLAVVLWVDAPSKNSEAASTSRSLRVKAGPQAVILQGTF